MRYVLDLNAREAMHLIELRSGREGHPGYRAVAHEMHAAIAEHHPAVAAAMTHVDHERRAPARAHPGRDARRARRAAAHGVSTRDESVAAAERRSPRSSPATRAALRELAPPRPALDDAIAATSRDRDADVAGSAERRPRLARPAPARDADVVVAGDTAVLTALVHDELERARPSPARTLERRLDARRAARRRPPRRVRAGHAWARDRPAASPRWSRRGDRALAARRPQVDQLRACRARSRDGVIADTAGTAPPASASPPPRSAAPPRRVVTASTATRRVRRRARRPRARPARRHRRAGRASCAQTPVESVVRSRRCTEYADHRLRHLAQRR